MKEPEVRGFKSLEKTGYCEFEGVLCRSSFNPFPMTFNGIPPSCIEQFGFVKLLIQSFEHLLKNFMLSAICQGHFLAGRSSHV